MRVTGTSTHDGKGVDVIVRVSGSAYDKWPDHEKITVTRCFTLRVSPGTESDVVAQGADCPDGAPLRTATASTRRTVCSPAWPLAPRRYGQPPRIQRMPGEGGCTVGNALDPLPLPH
ncbi:hypothetical protein ACFVQ4_19510 [Streptomyces laurentii]|uniref:hypothetical protein n=1 Tax=Streptomyces laurentii TaxID=39478 RepID=UPI0036D15CD2